MSKVRFGIIGVGAMGTGHCGTLQKIEEAQLTAVCDTDPGALKTAVEKTGVQGFATHQELIDSGLVDAVIIATPHYYHPPIGIYAMKKKLAVLSEKPLAVTVKAADEMIRVALRTKVPFAVMHQSRASAVNRTAHRLIQEGRLGKLYRTLLIATGLRTQAYYDSAEWRGTWKGEGGGVLINQAPHPLDMFTWLGGLPCKVTANIQTRRHVMECEDEASAILEYANGAVGFLCCSNNEVPGTHMLEFCGEKGKLVVQGGRLQLWELAQPIQEFVSSTPEMWGKLEAKPIEVPIEKEEGGHLAIIRNLARHILNPAEPLLAPGVEGINSMELINAIIMSGKTGKPVPIPVPRRKYETFMQKLAETTQPKQRLATQQVTDPAHVKA